VQAVAGGLDGGGREELSVTAAATRAIWHKSSYSACNGNCIEVAEIYPGLIRVRDTKDAGGGPVLEFSATAWQSFLHTVKKGNS
jgi:Domain of unknown function (DUF397)